MPDALGKWAQGVGGTGGVSLSRDGASGVLSLHGITTRATEAELEAGISTEGDADFL